jgi:cobalt-zinc-cadmium efflux system outer membrane protein
MSYLPAGLVLRIAVLLLATLALHAPRAEAQDTVAAEQRRLTLAEVHALVERANPRARAAGQLARAAEARVPGAGLPPEPRLQLGLMNYMLPDLEPDPLLGMVQLQLMQMVPLPGKLSASRAGARARADAARARADDVRWTARAQATIAFLEAWEANARLAVVRETRRLVEDVGTVAAAMYRVGEGRQADVLRAHVERARMDEEIVRMGAMAEGARARLASAAGVPVDSVQGAPATPAWPELLPPRDTLERLALLARPMLAAGAAEVRAAEADERLARRELWPDLEVGVQYGWRSGEMGTERMGSLMVGAAVPILARARQLRMRDEAAAMRAMTDAELEAMRAETRAAVGEAYVALESARRLALLYRTSVLPQAEAAASSSLAAYRSGAVDFMAVLDARMSVNR